LTSKSFGRASPVLFGPRTLRRTWGTRPVPNGSVRKLAPAGLSSHNSGGSLSGTFPMQPPRRPWGRSCSRTFQASLPLKACRKCDWFLPRARPHVESIGRHIWGTQPWSFSTDGCLHPNSPWRNESPFHREVPKCFGIPCEWCTGPV
jgi:hypothetical protein